MHTSEPLLRDVFESAASSLVVLGPGNVVLMRNRAATELLGADTNGGVTDPLACVREPYRSAVLDLIDQARTGGRGVLEFEITTPDQRDRWIEAGFSPVRNAAGDITAVLIGAQDATARKQTEAALLEHIRRLESAMDVAGLGFFEHDLTTGAVYASAGAESIAGVQAPDFDAVVQMLHPADAPRVLQAIAQCQDPSGSGRLESEYRIVRPDGEQRDVSARAQTFFRGDGDARVGYRTVGTLLDVTEQRRVEAQRDELAVRLIDAEENIRREIARDLHDDVGQGLSALALSLHALRSQAAPEDSRVKDALHTVSTLLLRVRDLSLTLRPSILDELGLSAAVRWFAERTAERAGLSLTCNVDEDLPLLSPSIEIGCFRVLQEALTNTTRHAKARGIDVSLRATDNDLELRVSDDGVGFDVEATLVNAQRGRSMGLLGSRERVVLLGGSVTLHSTRSRGSTLLATFPLSTTSDAGRRDRRATSRR